MWIGDTALVSFSLHIPLCFLPFPPQGTLAFRLLASFLCSHTCQPWPSAQLYSLTLLGPLHMDPDEKEVDDVS